jgi:hypothetical protein
MKRAKLFLIRGVAICLLASPFVLVSWVFFRGWWEFSAGVRAIKKLNAEETVPRAFHFQVNTFAHEVSSETIKDYYNRAAVLLAAKSPNVKTYKWEGEAGGSGVSTILQYADWYVEVTASSGNDSDTVCIQAVPGSFQRPNAFLLPNTDLPHGLLRCDWNRPG